MFLAAGSPDRITLIEFKNEELKPLTGRTLAQVASMRRKEPIETIMDLVLEDQSRVGAVYFMMSEDNLAKQIRLPWMSFGSDAASMAPEPPFTRSSAHPRAYGNFARLLGRYVREEKVIPLADAVHRRPPKPEPAGTVEHNVRSLAGGVTPGGGPSSELVAIVRALAGRADALDRGLAHVAVEGLRHAAHPARRAAGPRRHYDSPRSHI